MPAVLTPEQRSLILVLAHAIVPQTRAMGPEADRGFLEIIEGALGSRPAVMQRQIGLFLQVLRWAPFVRYRTTLDKLPLAQQDDVLRWFQDNPVPLLRKGFWGLKALIFMGYYGRADIGQEINYTPSRHGNEVLHQRRGRETSDASAVGEA